MQKKIAALAVAFGLASAVPALAMEEKATEKKQPVKMTETQLDAVAGGQTCTDCLLFINVSNNDIVKNVQVSANAAIAVLSGPAVAAGGNRGIVGGTRP